MRRAAFGQPLLHLFLKKESLNDVRCLDACLVPVGVLGELEPLGKFDPANASLYSGTPIQDGCSLLEEGEVSRGCPRFLKCTVWTPCLFRPPCCFPGGAEGTEVVKAQA